MNESEKMSGGKSGAQGWYLVRLVMHLAAAATTAVWALLRPL